MNRSDSDVDNFGKRLSWLEHVCCPVCGERPALDLTKPLNACSSCGHPVKLEHGWLAWADGPISGVRPDQATGPVSLFARAVDFLRRVLNPLSSPVSPLRYWSAFRTRQYYRRTLTDRALAERWSKHYLSGLDLPARASVLDHGCGKGRHVALLAQLGHSVSGQDIGAQAYWENLSGARLQVVPPGCPRLPWADESFDLVLDVGVVGLFPRADLGSLMQEMRRVLKPGGYWIVLEANEESYGRRHFQQALLSLSLMRSLAGKAGFREIDLSYEGYYAPVFPLLINFLRKQCGPWPMDVSDYDSWLARKSPPEKRGLWRLRLQRD